jgi:S1-C subfamily serine protease
MADRPELEPAENPVSEVPVLRRETLLVGNERGRLAVLVALCSLAGVAVGFGLSNMANNLGAQQNSAVVHSTSAITPSMERNWDVFAPTWLGVTVVTKDGCRGGAKVVDVVPNSPARMIGIRVGDVIRSVDGERIKTAQALVDEIRTKHHGDIADLSVVRDNEKMQVSIELGMMPVSIARLLTD